VAAWHRERPDLDVTPLEVLSRISRLAAIVDQRRGAAFGAHGLQAHEFDVLTALRRDGAPFELTAGELTARTHVTSGTMTSRLDRLVARRFVTRRPDPTDGRLVRVRLTASGRRRVDAALTTLLDSEHELLARLDDTLRVGLGDALRTLLLAATTTAT
jgi:DNA-binding MarR family transcriptional regulator